MPKAPNVLMLGSAADRELVRNVWPEAFELEGSRPADADAESFLGSPFDFIVSSRLPEHRSLEDAARVRFPLIVFVDPNEGGAALEVAEGGAFVVVRGAGVAVQLRQAAHLARDQTAGRNLLATVSGPMLHDLRGIVGVIHLAARLLEEQELERTPKSTHTQILHACRRITWWLDDLHTQLVLRLEPKPPFVRSPGTNWEEVVSRRVAELGPDHPRRLLTFRRIPSRVRSTLPVGQVLVVLSGLVDLAIKTTASNQAIEVALSSDDGTELLLTVEAGGSTPSASMKAELDLGPERWSLGRDLDIPFRITQAALLAKVIGGAVTVEWRGSDLCARARWPVSGPIVSAPN